MHVTALFALYTATGNQVQAGSVISEVCLPPVTPKNVRTAAGTAADVISSSLVLHSTGSQNVSPANSATANGLLSLPTLSLPNSAQIMVSPSLISRPTVHLETPGILDNQGKWNGFGNYYSVNGVVACFAVSWCKRMKWCWSTIHRVGSLPVIFTIWLYVSRIKWGTLQLLMIIMYE